jgi:hypothetical protein
MREALTFINNVDCGLAIALSQLSSCMSMNLNNIHELIIIIIIKIHIKLNTKDKVISCINKIFFSWANDLDNTFIS